MARELRYLTGLRASGGSGDSDPLVLEGYAAKFGTYSQDLGGFREKIKPGTFARALAENQDIRALMNHDANLVLGRTKAGTLKVFEDTLGLRWSVQLPNTQLARDLHTSVSRGDIDQCSFAFKVANGGEKWTEEKGDDGTYFASRELTDVDLFDVSAVTYPAYLDTNVSAREGFVPAEVRSMVEKKNSEQRDASFEKLLAAVSKALQATFGNSLGGLASGPSGWPKYWPIETYADHAIVVNSDTGTYYNVAYTIAPGTDGDADDITIGEMQEVEQTWTPTTDRGIARLGEYRGAISKAKDPDGDGDDDSELLNCLLTASTACADATSAADFARGSLNEDMLIDFVTKGQAAIAAITEAVSGATAELAEDENAAAPDSEKRTPDPAATNPQTEGVSKTSPKIAFAEAEASVAAAKASMKAAKAEHLKAKAELETVGDDVVAKAATVAKVAAAKASMKAGKAAYMKAAEAKATLKASMDDDDPFDSDNPDYDPDMEECSCRHCQNGLVDSTDDDDNGDCSDPSCTCQNRWSIVEANTARAIQPGEEQRTDKTRTKRVGGKDLAADNFAYVGNADQTETWKLPIHDAAHVRNALARFNQTTGIPAGKKSGVWRKIKAAAAKFNIEVSKEQNSLALAKVVPDAQDCLLMKARLASFKLD